MPTSPAPPSSHPTIHSYSLMPAGGSPDRTHGRRAGDPSARRDRSVEAAANPGCAVAWMQTPKTLGNCHRCRSQTLPGLHYKMRSGEASRSGNTSFKASRIRAWPGPGRATRRRASCRPSDVLIKMSPILSSRSSRRITCGVIRLALGEDRGRRRSGFRISVISPARLARWSSVFQSA